MLSISRAVTRLTIAIAILSSIHMGCEAAKAKEAGPAATPYPGGKWKPPSPVYGVSVTKSVLVTMRDGVRIPVDIYVPADKANGKPAKGRFPVILTRFWYQKMEEEGTPLSDIDPAFFVERGYIFISADVRGTGRTTDPGTYLGERDALDGVDLVNWSTTLPAANGAVGFVGCSAMGQNQLSTAAFLGPKSPVKAMIPACVPADQYRDTYTENGVWRPTWPGLFMSAPAIFGSGMISELSKTYVESMKGGEAAFDGDWWSQRNFVMQAGRIVETGAAILIWNGWQDVGFGGLELYAALQNAASRSAVTAPLWPGSAVSGRYQLLLGDWGHGEGLDQGVMLQWFETWLKGAETGLSRSTKTPIHAQDRVTKDWLNLATYPMVDRYTGLYLGAGTLSPKPQPMGRGKLRWDFPGEDSALEFSSQPFFRAMRLAGPIAVRLNAASSNTDTQFRFQLFDDAPDGSTALISHGMILGSMHELNEKNVWRDKKGNPVRPQSLLRYETPLEPGATVRYEILLEPTLWTIRPNHQLRLEISSRPGHRDCPMFPMIGGRRDTGCILRRNVRERLDGGRYTITYGGERASMLNLPLVSADEFRPVRSGTPPTAKNVLPLDWGL